MMRDNDNEVKVDDDDKTKVDDDDDDDEVKVDKVNNKINEDKKDTSLDGNFYMGCWMIYL